MVFAFARARHGFDFGRIWLVGDRAAADAVYHDYLQVATDHVEHRVRRQRYPDCPLRMKKNNNHRLQDGLLGP